MSSEKGSGHNWENDPKCKDPKFAKLYRSMVFSDVWKHLKASSRVLYITLKTASYNGHDTEIVVPVRKAVELTGLSYRTVRLAFRELEESGFIKVKDLGGFHCGRRDATTYVFSNKWTCKPVDDKQNEVQTK